MSTWSPRISDVVGRFPNASNATLLAMTEDGHHAVYKPIAGERPLWDFPSESLAAREVLTYELSETMGLGVVPETVLGDGPFGPGSIQRFVSVDERYDVLSAVERSEPALWPIAVLDIIANNADRKLGHILAVDGVLIGIDHGLTFHHDDKLRTVLWGLAGSSLPPALVEALERARHGLGRRFGRRVERLLGRRERDALTGRVDALLAHRVHPRPPTDRPALPWPAY